MLWTSTDKDNFRTKTLELGKNRPDRSICQVNKTTAAMWHYNIEEFQSYIHDDDK